MFGFNFLNLLALDILSSMLKFRTWLQPETLYRLVVLKLFTSLYACFKLVLSAPA